MRWLLSALSPVVTARSIAARVPPAPVNGLFSWASTCSTDALTTYGISASSGRQAPANNVLTVSRNSTRAGDSSSESWKSLSWAR